MLHRDVKPDNVLLGRDGRVVLTDFGIAQVEGEQGLTETGVFVGSPEYIAPERVLGQRPGPESDLWSLGVLLYAAVEGMSPFRRSHPPATLQAVLSAEPQLPARGSGALAALIMQLLRKDPAARPTAAEAREVLESVARPQRQAPMPLAVPSAAPGQPAGSRFVPPVLHRNRKAQFALGGGLLALAVALVLIFANPFVSEGVPADWTVREEPEVARASLAVPDDYRRVVDDSDPKNASLTFNDPSGVFTITLSRQVPDGKDDPKTAESAAEAARKYYLAGAQATMRGASSVSHESTQQGAKAMDLTTNYRDYAATDEDINKRKRDHFYVNGGKVLWQLTLWMPRDGDARADGDRLFDEAVKHLKILDL